MSYWLRMHVQSLTIFTGVTAINVWYTTQYRSVNQCDVVLLCVYFVGLVLLGSADLAHKLLQFRRWVSAKTLLRDTFLVHLAVIHEERAWCRHTRRSAHFMFSSRISVMPSRANCSTTQHFIHQFGISTEVISSHQQHFRPHRQRAGDGDALLLAAGEFARSASIFSR